MIRLRRLFLADTTGLDIENSYYILGEETGMYKLTDSSTAVKLALRDEQLEDIEIPSEEINITEGEFVSFSYKMNGISMKETVDRLHLVGQKR